MSAPPAIETESPNSSHPAAHRPRRRRRGVLVMVVVVLLAAAGVAAAVIRPWESSAGEGGIDNGTAVEYAAVTKGKLTARTLVDGTLGYLGGYTVTNRASGTYTGVPSVGRVLQPGQALYRVSGVPIIYLKGASTPAFRDLSVGTKGVDVKQLKANLVALKYADKDDVDPTSNYYNWATAEAVEDLQDDLGIEETGKLTLGQVIFLPYDKVRVTEVKVDEGGVAQTGAEVLSVSSTARQVTVALDASAQANVKAGDKVDITLPNLKTTPGTVASVGKVAKKSDSGISTIDIRITPKDSKATGDLDQAPVQVSIITDEAQDVLAVPVNALLALAGGGYAVEAVDAAGQRQVVPVELGMFDNMAGTVEVKSAGLSASQKIVVPLS